MDAESATLEFLIVWPRALKQAMTHNLLARRIRLA